MILVSKTKMINVANNTFTNEINKLQVVSAQAEPKNFENAAFFPRGLDILIPHVNGAFRKTGGIRKLRLFVFLWAESIFIF